MAKPHSIAIPVPEHVVDRFWAKVDRRGADECWHWRGSISSDGYGVLKMGPRKMLRASRLAIAITGVDPEDSFVCHACDVRDCVNPHHLFLGSHHDNMADMVSKSRNAIGTRHPDAKLNEAMVQEIRRSSDSLTTLAKRYGVTTGTIFLVRHRETWKHVRDDCAESPRE